MPREEFTIRITRKGEVLIEVDGMPVRRVKDLITYFEERVGPARQLEVDPGDATGGVKLEDEIAREAGRSEEEERVRKPNRLRVEE